MMMIFLTEILKLMKEKIIIGIAGDIDAGKDTVAKTIQYTFLRSKIEAEGGYPSSLIPSKDILKNGKIQGSPFVIKKFADKLKNIICILINCTRKDLENQEFKKRSLGPQWNNFTVREMLQRVGTELFRKHLSEDTWVNATFVDLKPDSMWILSDMRFPNEMKKIKEEGGITVKVVRFSQGEKVMYKKNVYIIEHLGEGNAFITQKHVSLADPTSSIAEYEHLSKIYPDERHLSETALDDAMFDYTVYNCLGVDELIKSVKNIMKTENLLYASKQTAFCQI
jgi:hypothetical protein